MSVIIRIALRWLAGIFVARGLLGADDASMLASDPELIATIETGIGLACGALAEGWYWLAKRAGWRT